MTTALDDLPRDRKIFAVSWASHYEPCPTDSAVLAGVNGDGDWPVGYVLCSFGGMGSRDKLYLGALLCVPSALVPFVVREHHASTGHAGRDRWETVVLSRNVLGMSLSRLRRQIAEILSHCKVFQAHKPPVRDA